MNLVTHSIAASGVRRRWLSAPLLAIAALGALSGQASASDGASGTAAPVAGSVSAADATRIITLGTLGGPRTHAKRSETANVLQVGDRVYLIDAGPGVSHQLAKAGLQPDDVNTIFLTHLHFDHIGGLSSLLGFTWVKRTGKTIDIYGPPGTSDYVAAAVNYLNIPMNIYAVEMPPTPPVSDLVSAHDVDTAGPKVIFQDDKVRVTAVENSHYVTIPADKRPLGAKRSYSYRFDTPDRSVVFTGDTGPSEALEKLAKGADVLVTEVMDIEATIDLQTKLLDMPRDKLKPVVDHMRLEHLSPEEVGKIAANAGVKEVVLTHLGPGEDNETDMRTYSQGVRKYFSGVVVVANDGEEF